ncbi:MAG: S9 family peptidase [Rikenellaceae bacterium]
MKGIKLMALLLLVVATPFLAFSQEQDVSEVTGQAPKRKTMGPTSWLKDGEGYSIMEWNETVKGGDVVRYEAADEKRTVLIPAQKFIDKSTGKPIEVKSFQWSNDNSKILIFNNTKRVWRYETKGDYWVLNLESGELRQLGEGMSESSMMFAKFSPDGTKVGYVSENNIYVEDIASAKITPITTDGSDSIVNGTFDWVYEEEFSCRDGFRWSTDGKTIAYWQSNTEGTGVFYMINNTDSIYPKLVPIPYPKAGTTNSDVKVGYVSAEGGSTTWIKIPGDPRNNYIPRMEFIPESNELFIQQLNRPQNCNKVWIVNISTGELNNIFTDNDAAWLDTNDNIQWLDDNKYFTWESDRSGYLQLYSVSRDGKEIKPITNGKFDIVSQVGIDKDKGYVYYISTMDNFTERYMYRSKLSGKGEPELMSKVGENGTHSYNMSPTGKWAMHTFSNTTTPPIVTMEEFPSAKVVRIVKDNNEEQAKFLAQNLTEKEFIKVDIGDIVLDAYMIKPKDFDASKKYPVIIEVYGEPASSTVKNSWGGGELSARKMADKGYIMVSIDNRGANVPRGREWRKGIYKRIGLQAGDDQAAGIVKMGEMFPFIDMERIGITGWSGGGSTTLQCMFRYPKIFKTGIAIAFVSHQKLYDSVYQERYMNTPQNNPDGYELTAPVNYAKNLEGNLMIIHGTGDDNVHYQSCELLINELVKHKKMFSMMSYPMRTHGIREGEGTSAHLQMVRENYWEQNLPAGGQ